MRDETRTRDEEGSMMVAGMAVLSGMIVVALVAAGWWVLGSDDYAQCASVVALYAARGIKLSPYLGAGSPCMQCGEYRAVEGIDPSEAPYGEDICARCLSEYLSRARTTVDATIKGAKGEYDRAMVEGTEFGGATMAEYVEADRDVREAREYVTHLEALMGKAPTCPATTTQTITLLGRAVEVTMSEQDDGQVLLTIGGAHDLEGVAPGEYVVHPVPEV